MHIPHDETPRRQTLRHARELLERRAALPAVTLRESLEHALAIRVRL
jgi:hypothetical protein